MSDAHQPVLLAEAIEGLAIKANGYYLDGTFGRGGHARAILSYLGEEGRLFAIDRDPRAVAVAQSEFAHDQRFTVIHAKLSQLAQATEDYHLNEKLDGVLLDLGVSSPQLDDPTRGFSFMQEGPLDMRMDPTQAMDAKTWLSHASAEEITEVIRDYGEERFAKRIANRIVETRKQQPLTTTTQLANLVKEAMPIHERHKHPATRTFLALRIFINQELTEVELGLKQALNMLKVGGRLVVISFHSLEDRIVKRFMRQKPEEYKVLAKLPLIKNLPVGRVKIIGKALKPSSAEIDANPRARSAILRIGEKIA